MTDYLDELFTPDAEHVAHTGIGAQARASAVGPYVTQVDPQASTAFYGYATEAERFAHASQLMREGREVIERIDGRRPCRPCIDFDGGLDKRGTLPTDEEIADVRDTFEDLANEVLRRQFGRGRVNIIEAGYDTPTKRSRHFIADGIRLADGDDVREFAKTVRSIVGESAAQFVDPLGSGKTFGLRLPGCPKKGDASRTLHLDPAYALRDAFVQPEDDSPIAEKMYRAVVHRGEMPSQDAAECTGDIISIIAEKFPWFGSPSFEGVEGRDDIVAKFERVLPAHCTVCDRTHDRRGAYICVVAGVSYLRCYAAESTQPALIVCGEAADAPVGEPDEFDGLFGCAELTNIDARYVTDAVVDRGEDIYIGSAWGTGKNYFIKNILPAIPIADLFISSRISLREQYKADVPNTTAYNEIQGQLDIKKNPRSIWQLEALLRVPAETVFENIILDELTAAMLHAYGGAGFKPDARKAITLLRHLIKNAGRIIVADNDLTTSQVSAIRKLRDGRPFTVYRNHAQPWRGVPAKIISGTVKVGDKRTKAKDYVASELFAYCNQQYAQRSNGESWHGAIAPCHSRKHADKLYAEAVTRYGTSLVKLHTGESCDFQKRLDFADAAAAWAGKIMVIYTGTVSVGVSADISHFERVFAFFQRGNAPAASSAQMLFRARQIKNIIISYTGGRSVDLPTTPETLFEWVTKANRRNWIPDEFRDDRSPNIDEPSSSNPIALEKMLRGFEGQMFISAKLEEFRSQNNFVGRMSAILARAGLDVSTEGEAPETPETVTPASGEEAGPTREQVMAEQITCAADRVEEQTPEQRDAEKNKDRSYAEKAGLRALVLAKTYGVDPRALQGRADWIEQYEPHAETFSRLRKAAAPCVASTGDPLVIRSEREAISLSVRTMSALGLDVYSMGSTITRAAFEERAATIAPEINDVCLRLYGDAHGARRKAKTDQRALKAAVGTAIGYIGAILLPTYSTARDARNKRDATGFKLAWAWDFTRGDGDATYYDPSGEQPQAFHPRPEHPATQTVIAFDYGEVYGTPSQSP